MPWSTRPKEETIIKTTNSDLLDEKKVKQLDTSLSPIDVAYELYAWMPVNCDEFNYFILKIQDEHKELKSQLNEIKAADLTSTTVQLKTGKTNDYRHEAQRKQQIAAIAQKKTQIQDINKKIEINRKINEILIFKRKVCSEIQINPKKSFKTDQDLLYEKLNDLRSLAVSRLAKRPATESQRDIPPPTSREEAGDSEPATERQRQRAIPPPTFRQLHAQARSKLPKSDLEAS